MKTPILFLGAFLFSFYAEAIYVKTLVKWDQNEGYSTCCIELNHVFYTDQHQYIGVGVSFHTLGKEVCSEATNGQVKFVNQSDFKKDMLAEAQAYINTDAFKDEVDRALLRHQLNQEGKLSDLLVSQDAVSGKLVLSFTSEISGEMDVMVEPLAGHNYYTDKVTVQTGENTITINYVPYTKDVKQVQSFRITVYSEAGGFYTLYQHRF